MATKLGKMLINSTIYTKKRATECMAVLEQRMGIQPYLAQPSYICGMQNTRRWITQARHLTR